MKDLMNKLQGELNQNGNMNDIKLSLNENGNILVNMEYTYYDMDYYPSLLDVFAKHNNLFIEWNYSFEMILYKM